MWFIYQFNKRLFFFKNEKGKLAAKTSTDLSQKYLIGQARTDERYFEDVQKFVFTENPQTVKVQWKRNKWTVPLKCSYCSQSGTKGVGGGAQGAIIKTKKTEDRNPSVWLCMSAVVPAKKLTICRSQRTKWRKLGRGGGMDGVREWG